MEAYLWLENTRQAMHVKSNIQTRSRNHYCRGKSINITYSNSVFVALGIQHAMGMRRTRLSSVASPALAYLSKLSHKRQDSREKVSEYKTCFDFL